MEVNTKDKLYLLLTLGNHFCLLTKACVITLMGLKSEGQTEVLYGVRDTVHLPAILFGPGINRGLWTSLPLISHLSLLFSNLIHKIL